ncbi:hypothetical protein ACLOJK_033030 [Asimina triloba]
MLLLHYSSTLLTIPMIMKSTPFSALATFFFFFLLFCCRDQWGCESVYSPADYERCAPFACGSLNVTFPFYSSQKTADNPRCGLPGYELSCSPSQTLRFLVQAKPYQVEEFYPSDKLITIYDSSLFEALKYGNCDGVENFTLVSDSLQLVASSTTLALFRCPRGLNLSESFQKIVLNYTNCKGDNNLFVAADRRSLRGCGDDIVGLVGLCECFSVPVLAGSLANVTNLNILNGSGLLDVLSRGFLLQWREDPECKMCEDSGGRCGYDVNLKKVVCLTRFEQKKTKHSKTWKVILGGASAAAFLIALGALVVTKVRSKQLYIFKTDHFKSKRSRDDDRNVQLFIKSYQSTLVNRYSYYEIQKMTNNFKDKIGEGGYGNVYKGKLADGRLVAAKMLEKSRHSGQDFINEVATIGRIHHVNVIRLLGFCSDGSKRALIYEFMHNGSLGNLISNRNAAGLCHDWAKLLEIAIGVARGIEYLHQGCETRILHLDIKPQNVLLDHNHNPKVSDFGLAMSYSRKHSAVALSDARGTIGYIAPEVFLRNLGGVSHKSDVYSYGMLLLEMVGGRKNAERETDSSKEYFPNWIYHQVSGEGGMEIVDSIVEEDVIAARKMVMVGLWCIQTNPAERPSMSGVLEMLTGKLEAIGMPPKPSLFSPPRTRTTRSQPEIFDPSSDTQETAFFSLSN